MSAEGTLQAVGGAPVLAGGATAIRRVHKLYLPYGGLPRVLRLRRGLPGECGLVLHWFRTDRQESVAPYQDLILGYASLTPAAREKAHALVDEMLTEEEFALLRNYLFRRYGEDTRTTILTGPVAPGKLESVARGAAQRPYLPPVIGEDSEPVVATVENGFFRLSEEDGYNLPFTVWGYYAPAAHPSTITLSPSAISGSDDAGEADD